MDMSRSRVEKRPYRPGVACDRADALVQKLSERFPDAQKHLVFVDDSCSGFLFEVESPTGDFRRQLQVWSQDTDGGLGFGEWHEHFEFDPPGVESALSWVDAVCEDELVLAVAEDYEELVDLRDPDALLLLLTEPWMPAHVQLRSWSGQKDGPANPNEQKL